MREFASQKALISYAERKGLTYLWEGTPAFARRQRLLSRDQYDAVLPSVMSCRPARRGAQPLPRSTVVVSGLAELGWTDGRNLRMDVTLATK